MKYPSAEFKLLRKIRPLFNFPPAGSYTIGPGDDAAVRVCGAGEQLVLTADSMVEGVHFSLDYMSLEEVGFKACAINLSDCAAMGAIPDGALVQVMFPRKSAKLEKSFIELYRGISFACRRYKFPIVGGNMAGADRWIIDITLMGRAKANARLLTRRGVLAGDGLWVSGICGQSSAGLNALTKWGRIAAQKKYPDLCFKHIAPQPQIALGRALAANYAVHAMLDVSDGISKDCLTLCYENNLDARLELDSVKPSLSMVDLAKRLGTTWQEYFLHGGEDYELLFAASPDFRSKKCVRIGTFTKGKGRLLMNAGRRWTTIESRGWDHFLKGKSREYKL